MDQENITSDDLSVKFGKILVDAPPGEEVVISGMAGTFPYSENIEEYQYNLENKIEMVTEVPTTHPEMPPRFGKIKDLTRFDAGFFDLNNKCALTTNPILKFLLERCYECIFDAGLNPADLEGTNTGVFLGLCVCEVELHWYKRELIKGGNSILGNLRSSMADRISHHLRLKGPTLVTDTACSSSSYALEAAFKAIRMGQCDAALVGAGNTVVSEGISLQFARLGVLSPTGQCRPFDVDGEGYVRSEAAAVIFLQKAKESKRIYAKVIHVKTNCDGYKEQGITYPSGVAQSNLLKEMYLECGVRPSDVSYIEAHGTGTKVGDPEEMNAIDGFFTPERSTPLLVGSCKSSIGHSEPVAALCSIVKVLLTFESGKITPNINYHKPRPNILGLLAGRMEVPVNITPFRDDNGLAGVSSFGFGGANAHVILKHFKKIKSNQGRPKDNLLRIVCVSGRTEEAVNLLLEDVANKFDCEYIGLLNNIFRKNVINHLYRGYTIISNKGVLKKSIKLLGKPNVAIYFGGPNHNQFNILSKLLDLQLLKEFYDRLIQFFFKKKIPLDKILSNSSFLVQMLNQLTLTELLKQLGIKISKIFDSGFGILTSSYYQDRITLEKFLESVYFLSTVIGKFENGQNGNGISIEKLINYKPHILEELKEILSSVNQINGFREGTHDHPGSLEFLDVIISKENPPTDMKSKHLVLLEIGQNTGNFHKLRSHIVNMSRQTNLVELFKTIGLLYENGLQPQLQKLYPQVDFPVSRGTPMISSKIKWKHDRKWFVPKFGGTFNQNDVMVFKIHPSIEEWAFVDGHVIDGRNLFPATGYLFLVWTVLAEVLAIEISKVNVTFENCKFIRACNVPKPSVDNPLELHVMIQRISGKFEITEENTPVVTGTVKVQTPQDTPLNVELVTEKTLAPKDIYKELRLRGYNYKGLFKKISQSNKSGTSGKIQWCDNWIAFMDNMLQMQILAEDSRLLYVPTSISKLTINAGIHLACLSKEELLEVPVNVDHRCNIIKSGGIEVHGLLVSSIPRRKTLAVPVLEKYLFVPNDVTLTLEQGVRVCMQVALENHCGLKIKAVEVVDEESDPDLSIIAPWIQDVLNDQPLVHLDVTIFSKKTLNLDINSQNKKLKDESDCTLIVGSKLLNRTTLLQDALQATKEVAFILSREPLHSDAACNISGLNVINVVKTLKETLVFLKKNVAANRERVCVNISAKFRFSWLAELKEAVKKNLDVVVWCQNEPLNGIIGLVNCINKEPDCSRVRAVLITDTRAPNFNPNLPFYKEQLDKDLAINVFNEGTWGSYRHLLLDDVKEILSEHCFANSTVRVDLSSIKWMQGPLKANGHPDMAKIYYSSLNFRDVMIASGRISADVITKDRREQECVQGFEFSGKLSSGKRVMGLLSQGTLATLVKTDESLLWEVPTNWTLREAATVPVVYSTCLYALLVFGKIKPGDSILIHSGTGGIGQAALNLCLSMGCTVFTTVGTEDKKEYIKRNFPQINERHIGNSRNITFEQMVMKETQGRGVDIVLNSLAEEKLQASVRCLAKNGRFLEIGKFDLANDNRLALLPLQDGVSYHGVMLDKIFNEPKEMRMELNCLIQKFIDNGAIKALKSTLFSDDEVEAAYRFMTTGKHMGKVLIEIRNEYIPENDEEMFKALPRYFCDPTKTYVICGGLGGFGLELADWLILRGAQNLVLTSRKGITSGYQYYRISIWKSYGCNVTVSTQNITTKQGCEELIKEANAIAAVAAIFNLAVVLRDAILENQTEEYFEASFGPKAYATEYLDTVTRKLCPELKDFVVFSSVSCGRGNAGQTNYGMSNSVMERICEKRRAKGYPALAVQWGAIGDVGLVAEMQEDHIELEIGGTLQQSISSCLQVLDTLLRQKEAAVVSSMVVAEKKGSSSDGNIMEVIGGILGIRDLKSVSLSSTLAELGMDSMTGVEVKQTLEREYNIFLSPTEIRSITLSRIKEMLDEGEATSSPTSDTSDILNLREMFKLLVASEEDRSCIVKLKTKNTGATNLPRVIAFPGIEGVCKHIQNLTEKLEVEAYGVNYISAIQEDSISKMVDNLLPHIKTLLDKTKPFHIVAHSVGCSIALDTIYKLEKIGYSGTVTLVDGSPEVLRNCLVNLTGGDLSEFKLANLTIPHLLRLQKKEEEVSELMQEICKAPSLDEILNMVAKNVTFNERVTADVLTTAIRDVIKRMKAAASYIPNYEKLKSKASLFKPKTVSFQSNSEDYGLGELFEQHINVTVLDGTHTTLLQEQDLANAIMKTIL